MKRLISSGLMLAFILSAFVIVFPTTTNGQGAGLVSSVLSRMEKNRQTLKSLRAGISMVKYNSQLGVEDKYNGVVIYLPGAGRQASVQDRLEQSAQRSAGGKQQQVHDLSPRVECCLHRRFAKDGR